MVAAASSWIPVRHRMRLLTRLSRAPSVICGAARSGADHYLTGDRAVARAALQGLCEHDRLTGVVSPGRSATCCEEGESGGASASSGRRGCSVRSPPAGVAGRVADPAHDLRWLGVACRLLFLRTGGMSCELSSFRP